MRSCIYAGGLKRDMNPHDVLQPIGNALRERSERLKVHIPILSIILDWPFTFSRKYGGLAISIPLF